MPHRLIFQGLRAVTRSRSSSAATASAAAAGCPFHQRQETADVRTGIKPFEAIPTPKGLPLIGTIFDIIRTGGAAKIHEYCDMRHKELGPIFREKLGPVECVIISGKDLIQKVYLAEGRFPEHLVPEPWQIYNVLRGITRGLFFMDGEHWKSRRNLLNHTLMAPQEVAKHGPDFNGVITDLISRWEGLMEQNSGGFIPNMENELYSWSMESLGSMLFGRRLGCVTPAAETSNMHEFVHHVQQIFTESANMSLISPKLASKWNLPVWRRFVNAADQAIAMSRFYVEERISEIEQLREGGQEVRGVLSKMLEDSTMDKNEIVNIVADLILAAADTTSHATQWALYSLAKHPECQDKLLSEIKAAVPDGEMITEEHLSKIPYSMNVIKETLRMYPIASFLTRRLPKKIILDNYEIPAGKLFVMSQYTVGRDPIRFPEPHEFKPDRWTRTGPRSEQTAHCCMPFGIGARACIGRRVAELKMRLLLTRVVQRFHLESANEQDVGIALRLITTPEVPIKLNLHKR
ncbi:cytochrome P450 10 [Parasteatoda tepidariorum]|uniref:cytochrome P450 10 n=1 Tax=Parasteatoda tepidariorum TaxID=114398 RepID=UPI00077FE1A7|nr:cytochrome P450 10 [Parasteatoda tepidariorum]